MPVPGDEDVLICVEAAAVNNTDINTRLAWYSKSDGGAEDASWSGEALQFPRIQGADVCGRIVATGKNISTDRVGERVLIEPCLTQFNGRELTNFWYLGSECDGGFARYTRAPASHVHAVDSSLSSIELASFPCSYSTAENMLTRAKVAAGDRVLVTGASGGVGSAAVQLAKARGAHVVAVTSASKASDLVAIGAESTLDREADYVTELGEASMDVVIDLVAGEKWPDLIKLLKPKGRYAVAGAIGGADVKLDVRDLYLKDLSFFGCTMLEPEVFGNLITHIEQGNIKPLVAATYPLGEIHKAQEAFLAKSHIGKIVLEVSQS